MQQDEEKRYHYISLPEFRRMRDSGELFESTMYAGHNFGSSKQDVEDILSRGKHVLTVMDICGAMGLKTHFPKVTTIYIQQTKEALLADLLNKPVSQEEKIQRIMALDAEQRNADICDYTVPVTTYEDAAEEILDGLFHRRHKKS